MMVRITLKKRHLQRKKGLKNVSCGRSSSSPIPPVAFPEQMPSALRSEQSLPRFSPWFVLRVVCGTPSTPLDFFSIVDTVAYSLVTSEHLYSSLRFGFHVVCRFFSMAAVYQLCCYSHGCRGKRFLRSIGMHHHQTMLLTGLHCQPSVSSRINRHHVGASIYARTLYSQHAE